MLVIANKNGVFTAEDKQNGIKEVVLVPQKDGWVKLPANNSSNRTWIKETEMNKIVGSKELPYRETSTRVKSVVSGKTWVDFLDEKDRATYEALKVKGEKALEVAKNKPLSEKEKAELEIARLEAKVVKLKGLTE